MAASTFWQFRNEVPVNVHTGFCVDGSFHLLWGNTRGLMPGSKMRLLLSCTGNCQTVFQGAGPRFVPTSSEGGLLSPCILTGVCVSVIRILAPLTGAVVSHGHCDVPFPDDGGGGASLHVLVARLHLVFDEVSVKLFGPCVNWLVFFFRVFCIFWIIVLFAKIFLPVYGCLPVLLTLSFTEQKFLVLMKAGFSPVSFIDHLGFLLSFGRFIIFILHLGL